MLDRRVQTDPAAVDRPARTRARIGFSLLLAVLAAALVFRAAAGVAIGSADLSLGTVARALAGRLHLGGEVDTLTEHIVVDMRLPRVLAAAAVGAGLALSGAVLQSLTGNVLADPYILGMSGGASLGAVIVLTTGVGSIGLLALSAVSTAAFVGGLIALLLVFAIATSRSGALVPGRLILAGVAVGQLAAAVTSALIYFADHNAAGRVLRWTLGSVAGVRWSGLWLLLGGVAVTTVIVLSYARTLDAFSFGERAAMGLGTDVVRTRWILYTVVSLCTALLVAQAGIIGFVGLVVPHAVRLLIGPLHARLLPIVALVGALLLVWADIAARSVLTDRELPLGLVTALVGVPAFIWLLRRQGARS